MKSNARFFILPVLLFALAVFLIVKGQLSKDISLVPFTGTIEKAENTDLSGYDYFKLSEAYAVPFATVYEIKTPGNTVTQVVYPVVSAAYMEKARNAYRAEHQGAYIVGSDGFMEWFETYKDKPKFYIQAEAAEMSETSLMDMMVADTLPKKIEGTRIKSFFSMGDNITSELKKQDVTIENSVFIDEGATPAQDIETANFVLGVGCVVGLASLLLFFLGRRKANTEEQKRQMMERFK